MSTKIDWKNIFISFINKNEISSDSNYLNNAKIDVAYFYNFPLTFDFKENFNLENFLFFEEKIKDWKISKIYVNQPYLSKTLEVSYIDDSESEFMQLSKENRESIITKMQKKWLSIKTITSTVYAKNWNYISKWSNSDYHLQYWCKRVELWCESWEGYELCEWCQSENHSEPVAYRDAVKQWKEEELKWASAYLHWHYRSCEHCCSATMEKAWILKLYMSRDSVREYLKIKEL